MIDKFTRKRKSSRKTEIMKGSLEAFVSDENCLVVSDKDKTSSEKSNRLSTIIKLLRVGHLNKMEKKNVIKLIKDSQDRFHIPGEQLTATHILQHNIKTVDEQPINTGQYRFS